MAGDVTRVIIEEFTNFIDKSCFGTDKETEGLKTLRTADGMHVNVVGDDEYPVIETGVRLHKK